MITLSEVPSNAINVANTVYVMKNGSDSTGLVERFDKPFLTIQAAINAADTYFTSRTNDNRVLIIVESGNYDGQITLQNFIDLDLGNSTLTDINGSDFGAIISDNGASFTKATDLDVNVFIFGSATIQTPISRTLYQYPIYLSGNGNFNFTLNGLFSNNGECILSRSYRGKFKLDCNYIYNYNIADDPLVQPFHAIMDTSFDFQGSYEIINARIEQRETTNARSSIIATFDNINQPSTKYCNISLFKCSIINVSQIKPAIGTLGDNGIEISGNINLFLTDTIIYNKYNVDSISALGTGSIINLYSYNSASNKSVNVNVTNKVNTLTVSSNVIPF